MPLAVGDRLPEASFSRIGPNGPESVTLSDLTRGRRVVIFAVPGAFTPTCDSAHVPGFIRTREAILAKGVDEIICLAVNDAHVMRRWGDSTGATAAGISMLADGDGSFARAIDMAFDAPAVGMMGRSRRYAMLVDDGVVKVWHPETTRGCEVSGGEAMLAAI